MRSLDRALNVFELLQRSDRPLRLSDIAREASMSLPTTLRILRVLQQHALVSQTDKTYRIGSGVLPAAHSFLENDPLVSLARPVLQELATALGLTASLHARLDSERILVARVDGLAPLRYHLPLGKRLPLTLGAAGRILLRGLDDHALQAVVDHSIAAGYEPAGFSLADLRERAPGPDEEFAISISERATGVMSVAVAVPRRAGRITEAISLTTPIESTTRDELVAQVPEALRAAARLSEMLGPAD